MVNLGVGALVGIVALVAFSGLFSTGAVTTEDRAFGERIRSLFSNLRTSDSSVIKDGSFLYDGVDVLTEAATFPNVNVKKDIAYGEKPDEKMDLYSPSTRESVEVRPVIMMVHGGGWRRGDKAMRNTVDNKVKYFLPKGYAFISINYPMAEVNPEEEVQSVGKALAYIQTNSQQLGIDPKRIVIMGHSAGAHLVALLTARADIHENEGITPWKGTVSLDGAMYDVVTRMSAPHLPLFETAFGTDPEFWKRVSPYEQYTSPGAPILFTCSTQRKDNPCDQSEHIANKIQEVGGRAQVLPVDASHGEANDWVGTPGDYTTGIQDFLTSLGMP